MRATYRHALRLIVLAGIYVVAALVGLALAPGSAHMSAFWPAAGVGLAGVLLYGRSMWPAIAVGALVANAVNGVPIHLSVAIAFGGTLAPVAAATALERLGFRISLRRPRDMILLMSVGGASAMLISAAIGSLTLLLGDALGATGYAQALFLWWAGDTTGVILVAPILLVIASMSSRESRVLARPFEAILVFIGAILLTLIVISSEETIRYLVIPVALWASMRFDEEGAAGMTLLLPAIGIWNLNHTGGSQVDLMWLQGLNATFAAMLLLIAARSGERRRAQEQLRRAAADLEASVEARTAELASSEKRLAEAQKIAHIGSFHWDATTDTNRWTDELYRIYGLEVGGEPPSFGDYMSFIDHDHRDQAQVAIDEAIADGGSVSHEYPVLLGDGTRKWVHANVHVRTDTEGNLLGLHGTCQDITDRKLADEALRVSEEKFRTLLAAGPDAVVTVDATGTITLVNDEVTKLLGYTSDELVGARVETLIPEDLRSRHTEYRAGFHANPKRRPMGAGGQLCAVHKDGTMVPVDVSLSPVDTPDGALVVAAMRDATERRQIEDALRSAFERERSAAAHLRELDASKNAFLSAVSHELRTPLTSIIGFTELLRYPGSHWDDEEASDLVERIETNARRLSSLLNDLLDLNRLQQGVIEPRRRATPVFEMVESSLEGLDLTGHPVRFDVADSTAFVDRAQTERIIQNLVHNAIKYTPSGTQIIVTAQADEDGSLNITVTDDGPGIPDQIRDNLFQPFTRAGDGEFTEGTGIGLALVDNFSRLHGGRAWVSEAPGGGASFHVELPAGDHEEILSPDAA